MTTGRPTTIGTTAAAAAVLLALLGHAAAEDTSCFAVIPAQAGVQPAILIDKCGGRTWQLTRGRGARTSYRWAALPRDDGTRAPALSAVGPAPAAATGKCFTFEGRKFCE